MRNFCIFLILHISANSVLCVTAIPPTAQQSPPETCRIAGHLRKAILSSPSVPLHIVMEFPSRIDKVLIKPEVMNAANRSLKATAIQSQLEYYSNKDHKIHLAEINRLNLKSSEINSFWINNAISVTAVPPNIINSLTQIKSWKPCVIRLAVKASILYSPSPPKNTTVMKATNNRNEKKQTSSRTSSPLKSLPVEAWGGHKIGVPAIWRNSGVYGQGVVVAVIDSGVFGKHDSLKDNWNKQWKDFVDTKNKEPIDPSGHGTAVASIVVGQTMGIAPHAKWTACRAFDKNGDGIEDWQTKCAQWITTVRPLSDVVTNSWGSNAAGRTYFNEQIRIWDAMGIHHVFPIGNSGPNCGKTRGPGDQPIAFGVGSADEEDRPDPTSSRGPNPTQFNLKPDISAPGVDILVAANCATDKYKRKSGTSFAAAHVAGAMALYLSAYPQTSSGEERVKEMRELLIRNSRQPLSAYLTPEDRGCFYTGSMYPNAAVGHGMLDISRITFPQLKKQGTHG